MRRKRFASTGIDLERVADTLERDGVAKNFAPFDRLMARIESRRCKALDSAEENRL